VKVDERDKAILFQLMQNARTSHAKIAKAVGIPEKTVTNRIREMQSDGIIRKYTSIINYQKLGFNRHSIYIDVRTVDRDKVQPTLEALMKRREVSCCYLLHDISQWKIYMSVWTKTIGEYDEMQTMLLEAFQGESINYVSFQSVRSYTYLSRLLAPTEPAACNVKEGLDHIELSEQEWQLIDLLRENARRPLLEIAREMDVHFDTVKRKMKKLKSLDIVQRYYPIIDLGKVGLREYTYIARVNPSYNSRIEEFITWAKGNPHFVIVIRAVGWVNLYYAFQVETDDQFKQLQTEIRKRIGDIVLEEYRIEVEQVLK
jgi:DNA-binding Lrp family transcriptional regulator